MLNTDGVSLTGDQVCRPLCLNLLGFGSRRRWLLQAVWRERGPIFDFRMSRVTGPDPPLRVRAGRRGFIELFH